MQQKESVNRKINPPDINYEISKPFLIVYALFNLAPHAISLPFKMVAEATISDIGEINARRIANGLKPLF